MSLLSRRTASISGQPCTAPAGCIRICSSRSQSTTSQPLLNNGDRRLQPLCASASSSASASTQHQDDTPSSSSLVNSVLRPVRNAWAKWQQHNAQQSGQPSGLMAMSLLAMPVLPGAGIPDLLSNRVAMVGFWAWFMAQFLKIFSKRFKKGVWDIRAMVEPGGMPSSHSSLCSGVTTAIAIQQGLGSPLFAAAVCFSVIVMYDAMGVRRHAGKQAEVLNQVINELMEDHPVVGEIKLKEVLGHTPRQVACGCILGVLVGLFLPAC